MRRLAFALLVIAAGGAPDGAAARDAPPRDALTILSEAEPLPTAELAAQAGGYALAARRSVPGEQSSVTLWDELRRLGGRPPRQDGAMPLDGRISR